VILIEDDTFKVIDGLTMLVTDTEIAQLLGALEYVRSHMDQHEHAMGELHGGRRVEITLGGYSAGVVSGLAAGSEPLSNAVLAEAAQD
jgi:hypothetical protein